MEEYILPVLRYLFGSHNTNKEELSELEKSIDSPNYRDKYFDISYNSEQYQKYNNNLNQNHENNLNNLNNENNLSNLNNNVQQHPNIRTNLNGEYGSDFVIMI